MIRNLISTVAAIALLTGISLSQSQPTSTSQQSVTANTPLTSADQRQAFQKNVKDVYFDFNSAELPEQGRATLSKNAEWLKAHPEVFFTIEGDADERGEIVYNLLLSDLRAQAARDALLTMGVPQSQILFATGWGKLYPVCTQSDEACWSQNRRSHLSAWPPVNGSSETAGAIASGDLKRPLHGSGDQVKP